MAKSKWVDFDVEIKVKTPRGVHGELAHHPKVVAKISELAQKIADLASSGHHATHEGKHPFELPLEGNHPGHFGTHVQNFPKSRHARAFAMPIDPAGVHLELTQSLLIKAAASVV